MNMDTEEDSFPMFMPSDASMDFYPDNKQSNFKIQLLTPIQLKRRMECSLLEIIIPNKVIPNKADDKFYDKYHHLFLYCNFVQDSYINEYKKPLLRLITHKFNKNEKCSTLVFKTPIYIPLNREYLDILHFYLLDINDQFIKFETGRLHLTLMLRPIEHY